LRSKHFEKILVVDGKKMRKDELSKQIRDLYMAKEEMPTDSTFFEANEELPVQYKKLPAFIHVTFLSRLLLSLTTGV
jgi:hypothetical protein